MKIILEEVVEKQWKLKKPSTIIEKETNAPKIVEVLLVVVVIVK